MAEDSEPLGLTIGLKADARGFLDAPIKHVFGAESTTDLGDVTLDPAVVVEGWVRDDLGRRWRLLAVCKHARDGSHAQLRVCELGGRLCPNALDAALD